MFSGWHTQIAAVCSSVPGCRRADGNTWGKTWLLPTDQVSALQQALNANLVSEWGGAGGQWADRGLYT